MSLHELQLEILEITLRTDINNDEKADMIDALFTTYKRSKIK